ncbi:D-alanyl-D-alanine carboxypeptidase (penicillin-binding protein 5/6) [Microbacterium natoriense]|uniref:D-alanyl-D-alanine carboxypeptidase (Penicillin-binding protein 5/6) n=1 Tax=Microbacterium natoriense TaxID=284570 RepID=A0AAW8ESC5_9MICO|nr:D-alanyl-D-alanine carboxypeptidase [Microbacterium natoriense]MDQ0645814.1 D-alanyl-D-alanine carboxypeptidase (penicillin-binding protein 5/6) [Microbacterium natoriense]
MTAPDSAEATAPVGDDVTTDAAAEAFDDLDALVSASVAPDARWAEGDDHATALTWIDPAQVADASPAADGDDAASLFTGAHLRSAVVRPGVLVPVGVLLALVGAYTGTTLLWPLHEIAPTVQAVEFSTTPAQAAAITWPAQGSAAVGIAGVGTLASSTDPAAIASISKVVSAMMVLDRMPLAPGEQGPSFSFTRADSQSYLAYKRSDQSALDVPVGGSLTEYQMLQGVLLGSANNYIDRLAKEIWGSDAAFADAAATWLSERGISGITIKSPSGFDERNVATPEALIAVAQKAMQNPVFAEIVGTTSVDLPGAGTVRNTNGMMADSGVVGVKTGTLHESWNLLTAKDVTVGDTTLRLYASVLTQEDDDMRLASTRSLFSQVENELQTQAPTVPEGTVVGSVETLWGAEVDIVTDADADVVLWNGGIATTTVEFDLDEKRKAGAEVGTLTTTGPVNTATTELELAGTVQDPSPWWRLTHPLELFGLTDK